MGVRGSGARSSDEERCSYQIHEHVGRHLLVLLVLEQTGRNGSSVKPRSSISTKAKYDCVAPASIFTKLTSWERVIPTRTITFSSQ